MTWELEDGTALQTEAGTDFQLESGGGSIVSPPDAWVAEPAGPRTLRQLYHWVWNNFTRLTSYLRTLNIYIDSVNDTLEGQIAGRNRWMGEWAAGTYQAFDQVRDNGWLMIANKTTSDRAAPQPTGAPYYISGLGDTPAWEPNNVISSCLLYTSDAADDQA